MTTKDKQIILFNNGITGAFVDNKQESKLQKSWLLLVAQHIASEGYNPEEFEYYLPDGRIAIMNRTTDGSYNWTVNRKGSR